MSCPEFPFTVHINYPFVEGPWGGGNQFLKALRNEFEERGVWTSRLEDADVILLNGNPGSAVSKLRLLWSLRKRKPSCVIAVRLDGPITLTRDDGGQADSYLFALINAFADGVVFQSRWSMERNKELGLAAQPFETVIVNAPDPGIFSPPANHIPDGTIRCIATSWSTNAKKGFDLYAWLDEHLDFRRYSFTFVGNSPVAFSNIRRIAPVPSSELGGILREHDIFLTASRNDSCSNSLIEALHCGLPAVYINDGGNPELVGEAGEPFTGETDLLHALDLVAEDIEAYRRKIALPSLREIAETYCRFFGTIVQAKEAGYTPKRFGVRVPLLLAGRILFHVFQNRMRRLSRKFDA